MAIIYRTSALAQRHAEIGGELEDWNGMGTAWFYDHTDERAKADYEAVRTKAGLMDVSGLKKIHLSGPHAAAVIDRATTRNVDKLMPGRAVYAAMLDDRGLFIDDCVIYRVSVNYWLLVHGTGAGHESLAMAAYGKNVSMIFDDDLHDMSLQGPVAVDFLEKHVAGIRDLAYFGIIQTKLFGKPVMISRTGYTPAAIRFGSWVWSSPSLLARPALSALRTTMRWKAASGSRSTVSAWKAPPPQTRARNCSRTASRWAS